MGISKEREQGEKPSESNKATKCRRKGLNTPLCPSPPCTIHWSASLFRVCRGRGLVLLALALAGRWHQGASQSEGEEHFQTGGADRRTKTIDLMSCKAQVAKCQTVHIC